MEKQSNTQMKQNQKLCFKKKLRKKNRKWKNKNIFLEFFFEDKRIRGLQGGAPETAQKMFFFEKNRNVARNRAAVEVKKNEKSKKVKTKTKPWDPKRSHSALQASYLLAY